MTEQAEFDESEPADDEEGFEEEFSLDTLSAAYQKVLDQHGIDDRETSDAEEEENPEDPGESDLETSQADEQSASPVRNVPVSPHSIIEAILFVGAPKDVKLTSRKIAAVLRDVSPREVSQVVRELNKDYEKQNAAYRIKSDGGDYRMVLDPELLPFQQEFFGKNRHVKLSQSVIDVLAVVAYNQPVTREQVDKIRGKPSGGVLKQLLRRELLESEPGKTDPKVKYYSTTDRFLDLFHLEELADLPQSHEVSDIEELAD